MRAIGVIIRDIVFDETAQVSLVEDEYVIQKISATASNPAFRDSILPGTSETDPLGFDATGYQQIRHILVELRISIQNRIAVGTRFQESFPQLLNYPRIRRMFRDIEMEDFASTVFDDEEAIQNPEGEGGHGEEVHGCDDLAMIAKESSPEFACLVARRQAPNITRDRTFRDVEAEFQEFAMNPGGTPRRIFLHHPLDDGSNLGIDYWPAKVLCLRSKAPKQTKPCSMPADNGFWFDDEQDVAPTRPESA